MKHFKTYLILNYADWDVVKSSIPYIKENIKSDEIIVISSNKILDKDLCGCKFLDENEVLKTSCGLSYEAVKEYLVSLNALTKNTGWFFQQFIKFGLCRICTDDYYLVWDADTIPMNPIPFFDKKGRPYFNLKREYFSSYFVTIKNLFGIKKRTKESFISEHMIFNSSVMREMLDKIESNNNITGDSFWQKILWASDLHAPDPLKVDQRFFSEFETYGTYCDTFYPHLYKKRKLRTLRCGIDFLGDNPAIEVMDWAAKDFDTISFEKWGVPVPEFIELTKDSAYRKTMPFGASIKQFYKNKLHKNISDFNALQNRTYFDFFFNKRPAYRRKFKIEDTIINTSWGLFLYRFKESIKMKCRFVVFKF